MKPNQLATLILRLMGIYCLLQVIPAISISISSYTLFSSMENRGFQSAVAIVMFGFYLVFELVMGILLIVKSVPLGEKLVPKTTDETSATSISFEQVQILAFAVVGVLIFAEALPSLLNSVSSFLFSLGQITQRNEYPPHVQTYNWRSLFIALGTLAKAALGLWMFFGARGFANFWRSLRSFATPKPPQL